MPAIDLITSDIYNYYAKTLKRRQQFERHDYYEETNNKQDYFGGENGLEEDNLQYNKKDDNYIDKILDNNHENIKDNNSFIGNKRKQTDNYSIRDNKIFSIHKDLSHRSSIDITFQKIANSQEIKDNNNIKDNNSRNNNKDLNKDSVINTEFANTYRVRLYNTELIVDSRDYCLETASRVRSF